MLRVPTAGYDTIFYFHHTYVDYQWAFWQEVQRLKGREDPDFRTLEDFDQRLFPFSSRRWNDNAKTLRYSRPQDTFDYKKNLCYEYDELIFDGKTPGPI